jgi:hypothetical protein
MFPTYNYRTDSNLIILGASVLEIYIISLKDADTMILRALTAHQSPTLQPLGGTFLFCLYIPD